MFKVKITKECRTCRIVFISWVCQNRNFCSQKCYWSTLKNVSSCVKGKTWKVKDSSKMSHPSWNKGLRFVTNYDKHHGADYILWMNSVKKRDNFLCRIADENCSALLEAHHILSWKDYPELRYSINNGITLCKKHHPKKRSEVIRLSPYFSELIKKDL